MDQIKVVGGFSDLKELLIQTYGIKRERDEIKLFFSVKDGELLMHNYDDHKQAVTLSKDITIKHLIELKQNRAKQLIYESLSKENPSQYLNEQFLLHGFFRA
ncbi:MAG: hypothetical protein H7061_00860 [Bdellovibrionaceae bacterium]|nr:hypothetical protein [Bdellovibrio sp.]